MQLIPMYTELPYVNRKTNKKDPSKAYSVVDTETRRLHVQLQNLSRTYTTIYRCKTYRWFKIGTTDGRINNSTFNAKIIGDNTNFKQNEYQIFLPALNGNK